MSEKLNIKWRRTHAGEIEIYWDWIQDISDVIIIPTDNGKRYSSDVLKNLPPIARKVTRPQNSLRLSNQTNDLTVTIFGLGKSQYLDYHTIPVKPRIEINYQITQAGFLGLGTRKIKITVQRLGNISHQKSVKLPPLDIRYGDTPLSNTPGVGRRIQIVPPRTVNIGQTFEVPIHVREILETKTKGNDIYIRVFQLDSLVDDNRPIICFYPADNETLRLRLHQQDTHPPKLTEDDLIKDIKSILPIEKIFTCEDIYYRLSESRLPITQKLIEELPITLENIMVGFIHPDEKIASMAINMLHKAILYGRYGKDINRILDMDFIQTHCDIMCVFVDKIVLQDKNILKSLNDKGVAQKWLANQSLPIIFRKKAYKMTFQTTDNNYINKLKEVFYQTFDDEVTLSALFESIGDNMNEIEIRNVAEEFLNYLSLSLERKHIFNELCSIYCRKLDRESVYKKADEWLKQQETWQLFMPIMTIEVMKRFKDSMEDRNDTKFDHKGFEILLWIMDDQSNRYMTSLVDTVKLTQNKIKYLKTEEVKNLLDPHCCPKLAKHQDRLGELYTRLYATYSSDISIEKMCEDVRSWISLEARLPFMPTIVREFLMKFEQNRNEDFYKESLKVLGKILNNRVEKLDYDSIGSISKAILNFAHYNKIESAIIYSAIIYSDRNLELSKIFHNEFTLYLSKILQDNNIWSKLSTEDRITTISICGITGNLTLKDPLLGRATQSEDIQVLEALMDTLGKLCVPLVNHDDKQFIATIDKYIRDDHQPYSLRLSACRLLSQVSITSQSIMVDTLEVSVKYMLSIDDLYEVGCQVILKQRLFKIMQDLSFSKHRDTSLKLWAEFPNPDLNNSSLLNWLIKEESNLSDIDLEKIAKRISPTLNHLSNWIGNSIKMKKNQSELSKLEKELLVTFERSGLNVININDPKQVQSALELKYRDHADVAEEIIKKIEAMAKNKKSLEDDKNRYEVKISETQSNLRRLETAGSFKNDKIASMNELANLIEVLRKSSNESGERDIRIRELENVRVQLEQSSTTALSDIQDYTNTISQYKKREKIYQEEVKKIQGEIRSLSNEQKGLEKEKTQLNHEKVNIDKIIEFYQDYSTKHHHLQTNREELIFDKRQYFAQIKGQSYRDRHGETVNFKQEYDYLVQRFVEKAEQDRQNRHTELQQKRDVLTQTMSVERSQPNNTRNSNYW